MNHFLFCPQSFLSLLGFSNRTFLIEEYYKTEYQFSHLFEGNQLKKAYFFDPIKSKENSTLPADLVVTISYPNWPVPCPFSSLDLAWEKKIGIENFFLYPWSLLFISSFSFKKEFQKEIPRIQIFPKEMAEFSFEVGWKDFFQEIARTEFAVLCWKSLVKGEPKKVDLVLQYYRKELISILPLERSSLFLETSPLSYSLKETQRKNLRTSFQTWNIDLGDLTPLLSKPIWEQWKHILATLIVKTKGQDIGYVESAPDAYISDTLP